MGKFSKLTIGFVINFFLTNNSQQRRKEDAEMKGWSRIAGKTLSVLFLCAGACAGRVRAGCAGRFLRHAFLCGPGDLFLPAERGAGSGKAFLHPFHRPGSD